MQNDVLKELLRKEIQEFLTHFEEYLIYIKLRLDEKDDLVVCISFHEAELRKSSKKLYKKIEFLEKEQESVPEFLRARAVKR